MGFVLLNSFKNRLKKGINTGFIVGKDLTFDVMENITQLTRDGFGTNSYKNYEGNKLKVISGFTNSSYSYDANGNLKTDSQKGIALEYNYLNLPSQVSGSQNVTYTYDASGKKLKKVSAAGTVDYVDGIQYKTGGVIDFIQTEEGIARNSNGIYTYEYNLSDHLGNVRATFYRNSNKQLLEVLQRDNYYAFGLRKSTVFGNNKYLYNGKEIQEELGEYDYGARFYDPVIGRWNVVDPMAESYNSYSPYNYGLNDPIGKLDPNGMWVETATGYTTNNAEEIAAFLGQGSSQQDPEKQEDPPKQSGRNAVNKPGTIVRKNSVSHLPEGDIKTNQFLNKWLGLLDYTAIGKVASLMRDATSENPEDIVAASLGAQSYIVGTKLPSPTPKGAKNLIPEGKLANHLFKGAGKLEDNPVNRTLIQKIANGKPLGVDTYGKSWYMGVDAVGKSVYTYAQNGVVKGAGYATMTPT